MASLFSDFLSALRVPHTREYSDKQFSAMPFQSIFGFVKLLQSYAIDAEGLMIADKSEITKLTAPFIAQTDGGFVIVTSVSDTGVSYISQGQTENISLQGFQNAWIGMVLMAYPTAESIEPGYRGHRIVELIDIAKGWVLRSVAAALIVWLFITNGLWHSWSTVLLLIIDLIGVWLCYSLVQKSYNIHTKAADHVCGVLQKGGCDDVLATSASSFFGIIKWSEVGFGYYSVSLLCLLIFPQYIGYLAAINLICLPFTVWSIWYQKTRAKAWCTLCVSVQASLWLQFICYFFGGWYSHIFPIDIHFFVLGATYVVVTLGLNALGPYIHNKS